MVEHSRPSSHADLCTSPAIRAATGHANQAVYCIRPAIGSKENYDIVYADREISPRSERAASSHNSFTKTAVKGAQKKLPTREGLGIELLNCRGASTAGAGRDSITCMTQKSRHTWSSDSNQQLVTGAAIAGCGGACLGDPHLESTRGELGGQCSVGNGDLQSDEDAEIDLVHGDWAVTEGEVPSVPQAAPMVLNLDDPFASTPAVLEMELERMSLDEMEDFEARMDEASIVCR
jgi:hypothetical protein